MWRDSSIAQIVSRALQSARVLVAWLKQHPKVLSIAGASIVVITYSVKEIWRDSVKERLDDLNQRTSIMQMLQISEETQADVLNADPSKLITPSAKEATDFARHSIVGVNTSLHQLVELNNRRVEQMTDFLHYLAANDRKIASDKPDLTLDLKKTLHSMEFEIHSAENEAELAALNNFNPADLEGVGINLAVLSQYRLAAMDARSLTGEIDDYEEELVSKAEGERHGLEKLLTTLTVTSNFLYLLGASIGIFGTLAGAKSENPSE